MTTARPACTIRPLDAAGAEAALDALAAILRDAVAHGASVNFLAGLAAEDARRFWRDQLPGLADGSRRLLVAAPVQGGDPAIVGTVLLSLAPQPNAPHRAEIGKMLVHSSRRRQGIGRRLLDAAEDAARAAGRSLLMLDTERDSAGDRLYRRCGWTAIGDVPDHALTPDGRIAATTIFYKVIAPHAPARPAA